MSAFVFINPDPFISSPRQIVILPGRMEIHLSFVRAEELFSNPPILDVEPSALIYNEGFTGQDRIIAGAL